MSRGVLSQPLEGGTGAAASSMDRARCIVAGRHPGGRRGHRAASLLGVLLLGLMLLGAAGCSRAYYRHQADCEAYGVVECASVDPRWPLEGFTIEPDPRSRMFDPFCPDYPPMPPDDPTAHRLMQCVDCKQGWPCWHCAGDTPYVENPDWTAHLPKDEQGDVVLDRAAAVEMALLHSPEYQRELENVYLSALDVSLQRFQFDTQFFGGNSTRFSADGPVVGGQSLLSHNTDLQMRKALATGGDLVVGLANSLVWQFAGPDTYSATTLLDFSLVQPLLRAGGRAVALESLTSSERALLGDIRALERYRRGFFVETVTGYLGLLEDQVRIRNQVANVKRLQQSLDRLETAFQGGGVNRGDVDRARQSLYDAQSSLLQINASYEGRLDTYKMSLGLPPALEISISDPLLANLDLLPPELTTIRENMVELSNRLRGLENRLRELEDQNQFDQQEYRQTLDSVCREALAQSHDATAQLEVVNNDMQRLEEALPERRRILEHLGEREELRRGGIDPSIGDVGELDTRVATLQTDFAGVAEELSRRQEELERFEIDSFADPVGSATGAEPAHENLRRSIEEISRDVLKLSLIQARARLDALTSVPIELTAERAVEIARQNRRDWMDARAALVDTWRQIELRANDLKSGLDVTFSGDISSTDNNPVRFRGTAGSLRVGLEFDAPLTRLAERNAYRQALISYQRARRDYYLFADRISQDLRSRLRTIRLNQLDFEVQRAAVRMAIIRVDETQRRLDEPPTQGGTLQIGESFVERFLSDFAALLAAQNRLLSVWVDQEVQRMNLDLDLGTMQLDSSGRWIDPGPMEIAAEDEGQQTDDSFVFPEALVFPEEPEEIPVPDGDLEMPDGAWVVPE